MEGARLAQPRTEGDRNYLISKLHHLRAWIGASDRLDEGTWTWEDGSDVSPLTWNPSEVRLRFVVALPADAPLAFLAAHPWTLPFVVRSPTALKQRVASNSTRSASLTTCRAVTLCLFTASTRRRKPQWTPWLSRGCRAPWSSTHVSLRTSLRQRCDRFWQPSQLCADKASARRTLP